MRRPLNASSCRSQNYTVSEMMSLVFSPDQLSVLGLGHWLSDVPFRSAETVQCNCRNMGSSCSAYETYTNTLWANWSFFSSLKQFVHVVCKEWPPLWSSGRSSWLQIQRSRVRFPPLPDLLRCSGSETGYVQPCEDNWGAVSRKWRLRSRKPRLTVTLY
jgi:hypothetical protein